MPRYTTEIKSSARRELDALPLATRERIAGAIAQLANEPRPSGCRKLSDTSPVIYRIRVGAYRILYEIRETELVILVVAIGPREHVYRRR